MTMSRLLRKQWRKRPGRALATAASVAVAVAVGVDAAALVATGLLTLSAGIPCEAADEIILDAGLAAGLGKQALPLCQTPLGAGEHKHRLLHKRLAGQAPGLGTAAQLLLLHSGARTQHPGRASLEHIHEAGDALTATTAVPQLPLQAIELDPFPECHLPEVLSGVTRHVAALTHETDHGHGDGVGRRPPL